MYVPLQDLLGFSMDLVLRTQVREFLTNPTLSEFDILVKKAQRAGYGFINYDDRLVRSTLYNIATKRGEGCLSGDNTPYLESVLDRVVALYLYVTGVTHPWKNCVIFTSVLPGPVMTQTFTEEQNRLAALRQAEQAAGFMGFTHESGFFLDDNDEDGGRNMLVEFIIYLRALEPLESRPYSKLFMIKLARDALTMITSVGSRIPSNMRFSVLNDIAAQLKLLESTQLTYSQYNWSVLKLINAFDIFDEDDMLGANPGFDVIFETLHYLMNPCQSRSVGEIANYPIRRIQNVADNMQELGIYTRCRSAVENIERWIQNILLPRIVMDAAISLNA